MKKLLFILLISVVSFSCSKDDEAITDTAQTEIQTDQIVGEWRPGKVIRHYSDGREETRPANECDSHSRYEFFSDNTIFLISYVMDGSNGCDFEDSIFEYHKWNKISEGKYKLTSKHPNEEEETQIINVSFEEGKMIWKDEGEWRTSYSYFTKIP